MKNNFITLSDKETKKIGFDFSKKIASQRHLVILALNGDLGSGKTIFTKGFLRGFGVKEKIVSPTFIIFRHYNARHSYFKNIYHFDFYRINRIEEAFDFGYEDYFYSGNYCFIEWPEKIESILPTDTLKVYIFEQEDGSRLISF